jgi:hypothetical protein
MMNLFYLYSNSHSSLIFHLQKAYELNQLLYKSILITISSKFHLLAFNPQSFDFFSKRLFLLSVLLSRHHDSVILSGFENLWKMQFRNIFTYSCGLGIYSRSWIKVLLMSSFPPSSKKL